MAWQRAYRAVPGSQVPWSYFLLYGTSMVTPHTDSRRMCKSVRNLLTIGMLVGTLSSCGYTLVGVPPDAPSHRLPLTILPFTNQTREPDLERLTTAALRQAIVQSQFFSFAADATSGRRLQGAIRRFRSFPLSLDAQDNVVQYRIEADMHIRLIEAATQRPILEQELSTSAVYLVSRATTDKVREDVVAREAALTRLAQQFADKCLALLAMALL